MYPVAYRWIRKPTPVISRTKTPARGSKNRPKSTLSRPTAMKSNSESWMARAFSGRPASWMNPMSPSTNEAPTDSTPSTCPHLSAQRLSPSRMPALASGITGTSQKTDSTPVACEVAIAEYICPSVLQQVRVVDARGASRPEDGHDDGEADHDLGRGHDHDEEGHDLPVQVAVHAAERDQRQVAGVEHQLDAHEQHDRVAPDQHPDRPDGEQDAGEHDVVPRLHGVDYLPSVPLGADSASVSSRLGRIGENVRSVIRPSGSRPGAATEVVVA